MAKAIPNLEQLQAEICDWIASGKSLAAWCRENKEISYSRVMTWLRESEDFQKDYARAHVDSGDADADQIKDITNRVVAGELDPQAARVAIDALKWTAGKRQPKKYGDKLEIDATVKADVKVTIGGDA